MSVEKRKRFAENIASHLGKGGLWLSLIGNADEQRRGSGPPRRTAKDIINAVDRILKFFPSLQAISAPIVKIHIGHGPV